MLLCYSLSNYLVSSMVGGRSTSCLLEGSRVYGSGRETGAHISFSFKYTTISQGMHGSAIRSARALAHADSIDLPNALFLKELSADCVFLNVAMDPIDGSGSTTLHSCIATIMSLQAQPESQTLGGGDTDFSSPSKDPEPMTYVITVHGIGEQRLNETILPVVSRFAEARTIGGPEGANEE